MGIIHKLKPEVINLILEKKKNNPSLSCRKLVQLLQKEEKIKVSKSSINDLFKQAGLSAPVGRKRERPPKTTELKEALKLVFKEHPPKTPPIIIPTQESKEEMIPAAEEIPPTVAPIQKPEEAIAKVEAERFLPTEYSGAIFLKAADSLIGGTSSIAETVRRRLHKYEPDLLAKTEGLIYAGLFNLFEAQTNQDLTQIWSLIGKKIPLESLALYLKELETDSSIVLDFLRSISSCLQEVRFIKVVLSSGSPLYLDGQLHTVWSTPYIPYDFSNTIHNTKDYLNRYLSRENFFLLFMAPGYDTPTQEFFNFLLALEAKEKAIKEFTLHGNKLEELETIPSGEIKRHYLIFGFWPWQFVEYRKVKKIGDFKPFFFEAQKKNFYLAQIEMDLTSADGKRSFDLRGCALKMNPTEKARLVIMSNLPYEIVKTEDLANTYLSHWPNLEEALQDTNRKIELFTYTAGSQRFFSVENLKVPNNSAHPRVREFFRYYLEALDAYIRWHFLPAGYEETDFLSTKERFYNLDALLDRQKDSSLITFQPSQGFQFRKDLAYLCRRLNEREISFPETKALCFSP